MARGGSAALEQHRGEKIGRYEVLSQLTSGGMAEIFLGFTPGPGGFRKYVVVKRILPDVKDNDQAVNMFLDEARITAAFSHPNIGQVFDLGEDAQGHYLVMEFIAGQNLNQVTAACARTRTVLPLGFSVSVVHQLALALHYAHTFTDPAGQPFPVIHRDVAQKNVMVTYEGVVKLLDFGIAKARGSLGRTTAGTVKGTTGYMSPEQVRGEPLDGRSDVFGLGVMLWEMCTGRRLFSAATELDEMKLILEGPIARPRSVADFVPEGLDTVVMRALARERADRFASAKEMARVIEQACPKLLFDQDQRATFMLELFEDKKKATQALLQSAQGQVDEPLLAEAVQSLSDGEDGAFVETNPRAFADAKTDERKAPGPTLVRDTPQDPVQALRAEQQATAEKLASEAKSGQRWVMLALGLAVLVGLASFVVRVAFPAAEEAPVDLGPRPLPRPSDKPPPVDTALVPGIPAGGAPELPKETAKPETPVKPEPPRPVVKQGGLTLVTIPASEVFKGKQRLGQTPMFNIPLPAGTHLLTLVGVDKQRRSLSVPVKANEVTKLRIELSDLPKAK
ncbi:MAG: protein kinase [Myxococcaceae bacterium]|nr:protein kinase [Myxococcaceae bacterium]